MATRNHSIHTIALMMIGATILGLPRVSGPCSAVGTSATYYVSSSGSDRWSGRLPRHNTGSTDGPFATLQRARDEARKTTSGHPVRIEVMPGTYYLARPLELGPQDSGLLIEGDKMKSVVISGGVRIRGFERWHAGILKADLSHAGLADLDFREFYYNGKLMPWARYPNLDPKHPRTGGFLRNASIADPGTTTRFVYKDGQLHPERWAHPERAWIVFHDSLNYETQFCPIKTIDPSKRVIEAERGVYALGLGSPYYVCGIPEELDAPGEWCVDPEAKVLYFWPPSGDPNRSDEAVVPVLTSVFSVKGDTGGQSVEGVHVSGLAIRDCRGPAVDLTGARSCAVTACDLRDVGSGVYIGDDTHRCRVSGCDITQTQGDGVSIIGSSADYERVTDHVVDNNYIRDIGWGRIHNRCGGVYMQGVMRCKVTHNLIHDTARYAIGMDVGGDCEIAYNNCHHSNLVTQDSSVIEAATAIDWSLPSDQQLARNRKWNWGNSIHHNIIHDSGGWGTDPSGALKAPDFSWGVYLDLHSSGRHTYDNLIYNTVLGAYMTNGGIENVFENNICLNGKENQAYLNLWTGYLTQGSRIERNTFAYPGGTSNLYTVAEIDRSNYEFRSNLVWARDGNVAVNGLPGVSRKDSWEAWKRLGQDEGSLIADPMFADPTAPGWRLKPSSPAFGLGFKSFDLSKVGNYTSSDRRTWPRPEEKIVRDSVDYAPAPAK